MADNDNLFERLKARGEEVFGQVSSQLMQNPQFMKAMQGALKGKEALDEAASRALKQMNIPTRSEFKKAVARIESLEAELQALRAKAARPAKKRTAKKRGGGGGSQA